MKKLLSTLLCITILISTLTIGIASETGANTVCSATPIIDTYQDENNGWRHFYNSNSGKYNLDIDDQSCLYLGTDSSESDAKSKYSNNKLYQKGYYLLKFAVYYWRGNYKTGTIFNQKTVDDDLPANNSGDIFFSYYSKHGTGNKHSTYFNSVVPTNNWSNNSANDACAFAIVDGIPDYASASVNFSSSSGTIDHSTIWLEMYIYNAKTKAFTKISNGAGASLSKGIVTAETEIGYNAKTANSFGTVIPTVSSDSVSLTCKNITLNNDNLTSTGFVKATAIDQYGVTLEPDSFSVPFTNPGITVEPVQYNNGDCVINYTANYKCESQSTNAIYCVSVGSSNGRFANTNQNKTETVTKSITTSVTNSVSTCDAKFNYFVSNDNSITKPTLKTTTIIVTPGVDIVSEPSVTTTYYDDKCHYTLTGWDKETNTTITSDTVFTAQYFKSEHNFKLVTTQTITDGSSALAYFECECGAKIAADYNSKTNEFTQNTNNNYTNSTLPTPEINNYSNNTIDYSARGASIRLFGDNTDSDDNTLPVRYTTSVTLPNEVKQSDIVDFGFVYTKAKYFNNGVDPITNNIFDYENSLVIGAENIIQFSVFDPQGNPQAKYSVHHNNGQVVLTTNIVINEDISNWKDHYVCRSFVKYKLAGKTITIYDRKYSSRSAKYVAERAYNDYKIKEQNGKLATLEKEMMNKLSSKILSNYTTSLEMLRQRGKCIITPNNQEIRLTGVNLGNWLLQEAWMGPINKGDADHWGEYDTYSTLVKRFGTSKADALFDTYRSNFITEKDLDYLSNIGINCVRVPFWFENFTYSETSYSSLKLDSSNQPVGLTYLDWIISECGQRNIYVILDAHGLYGFQSTNHSTGRSNAMSLYSFTSSKGFLDSKEYVDSVTVNNTYLNANKSLWKDIASRYKDNPVVAGYDIMNEPLNNDELSFRAPSNSSKYSRGDCYEGVYNELYKAIRTVDQNHIIIMEGIWDIEELPSPSKYDWENIAYSCHNYNYSKSEIEGKVSSYNLFNESVPMIVGEFEASDYDGENGGTGLRKTATTIYNNAGFSWLTWTYKAVKKSNVGSGWYMCGVNSNAVIDPNGSSYEQIKTAWSKNVTNGAYTTWPAEMTNYYFK